MNDSIVSPIRWTAQGLELLDQRLLPAEEKYVLCRDATETAEAIRAMVVRGAPAIGISAAYGIALAARGADGQNSEQLNEAFRVLAESRPTAVNLFWALDRMRGLLGETVNASILEAEAIAIHEEDFQANLSMGEAGANLIEETGRASLITHCNTGSLATGGYGTALGVIRSAVKRNLVEQVFADETRPWLQGARLTAWELTRDRIPVTLIADSAAAHVMKTRPVSWVVVGADRITANGDVANKIGTYSLAVLARQHGVKFMVVAPSSTIDFSLTSGADIPIEERTADELKKLGGVVVAPAEADAFNPVFDVTPASLIDAIVTERGVVRQPDTERMNVLR